MELRLLLKRVLLIWVLLVLVVALLGRISVADSGSGRTAADFLNIGLGARAAGLGGAFTAVSEGATAAYWNPAGLAGIEGGEVALGHFEWLQDVRLEHGTAAYRVNDKTTVAASITYLNYGTIEGYDISGSFTQELSAYDWTGAFSVGYSLNDNVSLGATAKYINQTLDDVSGSSFAGDFGVKYQANRFALAAFLGNIGTEMKFDAISEKLPSSGRVGIALTPFGERIMTSVEFEKKFYGTSVVRQGFEFNYGQQYFLRTGYNYYPEQSDRSFGTGLSFGAGFRMRQAEIDYAYTPAEKLTDEDLHRFSLVFKFGQ